MMNLWKVARIPRLLSESRQSRQQTNKQTNEATGRHNITHHNTASQHTATQRTHENAATGNHKEQPWHTGGLQVNRSRNRSCTWGI